MEYLSDVEIEELREQMIEQDERLKEKREKERRQLHDKILKLLEGKI